MRAFELSWGREPAALPDDRGNGGRGRPNPKSEIPIPKFIMTDIAIRVENLSKKYHIGRAKQRHDTLRDLMVDTLRAPFRGRDGNPEEG